jgi:hypothetical protein
MLEDESAAATLMEFLRFESCRRLAAAASCLICEGDALAAVTSVRGLAFT